MDDIVTRLRERASVLTEEERPLSDATVAADEIKRLRLEIERLRGAAETGRPCAECRFWLPPSHPSTNLANDRGQCRRYAPKPLTGDFLEQKFLPLLGLLVRAQAKVANFDLDGDGISEEESMAFGIPESNDRGWANTYGDDWCGEWQAKAASEPAGEKFS